MVDLWKPGKGSERKADCAASTGGILLPIFPSLLLPQGAAGGQKKGPEDNGTSLPHLRSDPYLVVASKMTFVPRP